jgi:hypothetical protein
MGAWFFQPHCHIDRTQGAVLAGLQILMTSDRRLGFLSFFAQTSFPWFRTVLRQPGYWLKTPKFGLLKIANN